MNLFDFITRNAPSRPADEWAAASLPRIENIREHFRPPYADDAARFKQVRKGLNGLERKIEHARDEQRPYCNILRADTVVPDRDMRWEPVIDSIRRGDGILRYTLCGEPRDLLRSRAYELLWDELKNAGLEPLLRYQCEWKRVVGISNEGLFGRPYIRSISRVDRFEIAVKLAPLEKS